MVFILVWCSKPVGGNVLSCLVVYDTVWKIITYLILVSNIFKHCQNAVDNELKDVTSVLFELLRIRDGYCNLDFDDYWLQGANIHWCYLPTLSVLINVLFLCFICTIS